MLWSYSRYALVILSLLLVSCRNQESEDSGSSAQATKKSKKSEQLPTAAPSMEESIKNFGFYEGWGQKVTCHDIVTVAYCAKPTHIPGFYRNCKVIQGSRTTWDLPAYARVTTIASGCVLNGDRKHTYFAVKLPEEGICFLPNHDLEICN